MLSARTKLFFSTLVGAVCITNCAKTPAAIPKGEIQSLSGTLFYLVGEGDGHEAEALHRFDFASLTDQPITSGVTNAYVYPADRQHVFIVEQDDVFVFNLTSNERRRLASSDGIDWYPRLSPDHETVLFESARASFRDLYAVPFKGGEVTRLTNDREGNFDGAWSRSGKQIAFASSRHGQLDLFVMNVDGSKQRRLSLHPGDSIRPQWSPDGKQIAFISRRDGVDDIFLVNVDGSRMENFTRALSGDSHDRGGKMSRGSVEDFAWHPTKKQIIVAARHGKKSRMTLLDVDARSQKTLTNNAASESQPCWSPDGEYIAFRRRVDKHSEIWLMRGDGSSRVRLSRGPSGTWLPRWVEAERKANEK